MTLPAAGAARLDVVDALGRRVAVLADGDLGAGPHAFALPGLASGVYTARLSAGDAVQTVRFTVVR